MTAQRKEITRLWRKHGWGRLYWKAHNSHWRNFWNSEDVAAVRDGPVSIHFQSIDAIMEEIEYGRGQPEATCQEKACTTIAYGKYHIYMLAEPDLDLWLCWDHAVAYGCCPVCGHHGGYSGMCSQCLDENF